MGGWWGSVARAQSPGWLLPGHPQELLVCRGQPVGADVSRASPIHFESCSVTFKCNRKKLIIASVADALLALVGFPTPASHPEAESSPCLMTEPPIPCAGLGLCGRRSFASIEMPEAAVWQLP